MSFRTIAAPLIARGISVVPVDAGAKRCRLPAWPTLATTDAAAIERWHESAPDANVGCVAKPDGVCVIDCDIAGIPEFIEASTGCTLPATFTVMSAGRRCPHLYFKHTDKSRALGNRSLPGKFDFKAHNSYVVGPGSVLMTESGPRTYDILSDVDIAPIPDWLVAWISTATRTDGTAIGSCRETRRVSENFDIDAFLTHYGLTYRQKLPWYVTDICPVAGHKHEQSTETGFYYDGQTLGFKCFATNCAGSAMTVGDVIRHMNQNSSGFVVHTPYAGAIWTDREDALPTALTASDSWIVDYADFSVRDIAPRRELLKDKTTDATVLYSESLNQIFSQRGIGKSVFTTGLMRTLIEGGEFLNYKSDGGFRVLHCDGELPDALLQKRLKAQIKPTQRDQLLLLNSNSVPNSMFPQLVQPAYQAEFIRQVKPRKPDIIVFDTLTACFRLDTNSQKDWDAVNQFYITLRNEGYCVIVVHHAGKNDTVRGITNGDDNLDLSIKLNRASEPGDGCRFHVEYEKVREEGKLDSFTAIYEKSLWTVADPLIENEDYAEVVRLLQMKKSIREIVKATDITKFKVEKYLKMARASKLIELPKVKL